MLNNGTLSAQVAANSIGAIRLGIILGFANSVIYPVLIFASLPDLLVVVLAALLGPCLIGASWGLHAFITVERRTVWVDLAMLCNAVAGALFTAMLLVQLAARLGESASVHVPALLPIWLGLDVAWDVYIGIGTFLFGFAAIAHERLGRVIGILGMAGGVLVLALNLWTFPTPPAEAGSFDIGPFIGLWYLAVTVMILRSMGWVRNLAT